MIIKSNFIYSYFDALLKAPIYIYYNQINGLRASINEFHQLLVLQSTDVSAGFRWIPPIPISMTTYACSTGVRASAVRASSAKCIHWMIGRSLWPDRAHLGCIARMNAIRACMTLSDCVFLAHKNGLIKQRNYGLFRPRPGRIHICIFR